MRMSAIELENSWMRSSNRKLEKHVEGLSAEILLLKKANSLCATNESSKNPITDKQKRILLQGNIT